MSDDQCDQELEDIDPNFLTEGEQNALADIEKMEAGIEVDAEVEEQPIDPEPLKSEMPDWVQRMRDEADELVIKINKLSAGLANPDLTPQGHKDMIEQRTYMQGYYLALTKRIAADYAQ